MEGSDSGDRSKPGTLVQEEKIEVEKGRLTFMLMLCTLTVSAGSSMEFGYNLGVVAGPYMFIQDFINETYFERSGNQMSDSGLTWMWATLVSIYCVGGALGALVGGHWADYFGRNRGIIYNNVFSIVASALMGCCLVAESPELLIVGRFIMGISCGITMAVVPIYLAEIAPFNLRGAVSVTAQLFIQIGILLAQVLGFYAFYDEELWPTVFGLSGAAGLLEFLILPFCPESPRWLLFKKNDIKGATEALRSLRGVDDVEVEVSEMKNELENESTRESVGMVDLLCLKDRSWKRPLIVCVVLHAGMQFAGLNAIVLYSTDIYYSAGMNEDQVGYATVGFGSLFVLITVVSIFAVERLGRRSLVLYPYGFLTIWLAGLTTSLALQDEHEWMTWLSLAFVYLYVISLGIGPAPIPYVLSTELFSQGPRSAAVSISGQVNWWSNFIVQLTFPLLVDAIEQYVFLIYMSFTLVITIFIFFYVPETKNKSFDEIASMFRKDVADGTITDPKETEEKEIKALYVYENKAMQTDEVSIDEHYN